MCVRPDDRSDPAVEPTGQRDLLAGRLRMGVDEDERSFEAGLLDQIVDELEHRGGWMEEQRSEHVDHR